MVFIGTIALRIGTVVAYSAGEPNAGETALLTAGLAAVAEAVVLV